MTRWKEYPEVVVGKIEEDEVGFKVRFKKGEEPNVENGESASLLSSHLGIKVGSEVTFLIRRREDTWGV